MNIGMNHCAAVLELVDRLAVTDVVWALTGSLGHCLQGVPLEIRDIDVQTDEAGVYQVAECFKEAVIRPVAWRPGEGIRSHFGELCLNGVAVEIMGALQKQLPDGSWEQPVDVSVHRVFVDFQGRQVPVMSIEYEWRAYEDLGRTERAKLLRRYARSGVQHAPGELLSRACEAAGGPGEGDSELQEE
jgi:hypothetical protein